MLHSRIEEEPCLFSQKPISPSSRDNCPNFRNFLVNSGAPCTAGVGLTYCMEREFQYSSTYVVYLRVCSAVQMRAPPSAAVKRIERTYQYFVSIANATFDTATLGADHSCTALYCAIHGNASSHRSLKSLFAEKVKRHHSLSSRSRFLKSGVGRSGS